jgi:cell division GTPase FtsZ
MFLIDNSKIESLYKGISPAQFWSTVNNTITGLFQTFNFLSTQESNYTSFDAEDYKTVLSAPGYAVLGVTKVKTTGSDLSIALQENFKKTVLAAGMNYSSARQAGCILAVNNNDLNNISMDDLNYAFDAFNALVGGADVHRGLYGAKSEGTKAYTMVTGLKEDK